MLLLPCQLVKDEEQQQQQQKTEPCPARSPTPAFQMFCQLKFENHEPHYHQASGEQLKGSMQMVALLAVQVDDSLLLARSSQKLLLCSWVPGIQKLPP